MRPATDAISGRVSMMGERIPTGLHQGPKGGDRDEMHALRYPSRRKQRSEA